ncbi:hypothetical protein [Niastella vici]|nr:hypothetical protein [Niastella vici]
MDEALQIWGYKSIPGFYMLIDEGRWLTEVLEGWLFRMTDRVHDVTYIRLVSLFGWLACLPVWYMVIKRLVAKVSGYKYLPFFSCLYLITSLPFIVSVQWATCMQFFIADTAALLSGALVLQGIHFKANWWRFSARTALPALFLGVVSLFFYQGAFACFLLPFLLNFINPFKYKKDTVLLMGLAFYLFVYAVYFVLYKLSFSLLDIPPDPRNSLYIHPWEKLKFFLARPLERSFRFTLLTHEDSPISQVLYPLMLLGFSVLTFIRFGKAKWRNAVKYLAGVGGIFIMSYLPALLIQESFASNRTLMALDLFVFIVCLEMVLFFIKDRRLLQIAGVAMTLFFVVCARYNFQYVFLRPVQQETAVLKNYFKQHYHPGITTVHFIRPSEDFMAEKYRVNRSMDEFGVSSSCWDWVPESLTKQFIYEATGNREQAAGVQVKQWAGKAAYLSSGESLNNNTLLVDVPAILNQVKP